MAHTTAPGKPYPGTNQECLMVYLPALTGALNDGSRTPMGASGSLYASREARVR